MMAADNAQNTVKFDLARHVMTMINTESAFFAEISRHVRKVADNSPNNPTMRVSYDFETSDLTLHYNENFCAGLNVRQLNNVIKHEFYHLILGHLLLRRAYVNELDDKLHNWAADMAINSMLVEKCSGGDAKALPEGGLLPGHNVVIPKDIADKMSPDELATQQKINDMIASFPKLESTEAYYNLLVEACENDPSLGEAIKGSELEIEIEFGDGDGEGSGSGNSNGFPKNGKVKLKIKGRGTLDQHGDGKDGGRIPEEIQTYIGAKIKDILRKAAQAADNRTDGKGWGDLPEHIRHGIRALLIESIDWRAVLRQFIGSLIRAGKTTTIKKINKKYPLIHPGKKVAHAAKLAIAIDMSGSVSDELLSKFFAELAGLTRRVTVDIIPFDCTLDPKDIYTWKKGKRLEGRRVRCGGTDFDAPTKFVNDPKNRGRWDGLLIMTDGQAPKPVPSRVKRGWVLGEKDKLYFEQPNEIQVFVGQPAKKMGPWY